MQTINISLPDALRQYVEEQVRSGDYGSTSEYFRDLIRGDQKRKAKEALLAALADAEDEETTPDW